DLLSIAEVVRDLHRCDDQREQSYSERQLYEAALDRLTREVAAVGGLDEGGAQKRVGEVLLTRAA
ncbi:CarD family transcriptional regulator, partial [Paracoccus sp. S4493]